MLAPVNVCSGFSAVACQILTVPSSLHEASILPEGSHLSPLMSDLCAPCTAQRSEAVSRHAAGLSIHSKVCQTKLHVCWGWHVQLNSVCNEADMSSRHSQHSSGL